MRILSITPPEVGTRQQTKRKPAKQTPATLLAQSATPNRQIVAQLPQESVPQLGMLLQPVDNKAQHRYSLASKMLEYGLGNVSNNHS
jgi:hypothetical protein